jgi:hypothetical protein
MVETTNCSSNPANGCLADGSDSSAFLIHPTLGLATQTMIIGLQLCWFIGHEE